MKVCPGCGSKDVYKFIRPSTGEPAVRCLNCGMTGRL